MRIAIFASFLHVASSESNNYHAQCNISWCQSQRDSANKTNLYKPGVGLSASVIKMSYTYLHGSNEPEGIGKVFTR